jgi:hypothetical protein
MLERSSSSGGGGRGGRAVWDGHIGQQIAEILARHCIQPLQRRDEMTE